MKKLRIKKLYRITYAHLIRVINDRPIYAIDVFKVRALFKFSAWSKFFKHHDWTKYKIIHTSVTKD